MKKYRLLNIITLGLGIAITASAVAESADQAGMDAQGGNESQSTQAVTDTQENKDAPAYKAPSQEDIEWMDKMLRENTKGSE